jgi:16S rRNA (guanine966-N2)-methyltransferase
VDADRRARRAIEANLTTTKLADRALVVGDAAVDFLEVTERHFDVAILDPPYAYDRWHEVLAALDAEIAVLESDRPVEPGAGWTVVRTRAYGTTVVTVCRRSVSDPQEKST